MIDIHNHILPGVDDGPTSIKESVQMAKDAYEQGITKIVASPHHMNGTFKNEKEDIQLQVNVLNEIITAHDIPVEIIPGQEVRIYEQLIVDFEADKILTINESKYVLLELPFDHIPNNTQDIIIQLLHMGIIPIIAHPERYSKIRGNMNLLYELILLGATAQLTASSLLGVFGKEVHKFSYTLLQHQLVHFIASDAHNSTIRFFDLKEAYEQVASECGMEVVEQLKVNSQSVIDNKEINRNEPIRAQLRKNKRIF